MASDLLTSFFLSDNTLRSRLVSEVVHSAILDVPQPPARLLADWQRETATHVLLEPGDVEVMPLARARMRWPDYTRCVHAMSEWTASLGMPDMLATSDVALMACRGARYHHDAEQYGGSAFCNLFMSEDKRLDLHFPALKRRIPLTRGTVVMFDTGQPHAVIPRERSNFNTTDFPPGEDYLQIFLTWELPIEDPRVSHALNVSFDVDPSTAAQLDEEQLRLNGRRVALHADSGGWRTAD